MFASNKFCSWWSLLRMFLGNSWNFSVIFQSSFWYLFYRFRKLTSTLRFFLQWSMTIYRERKFNATGISVRWNFAQPRSCSEKCLRIFFSVCKRIDFNLVLSSFFPFSYFFIFQFNSIPFYFFRANTLSLSRNNYFLSVMADNLFLKVKNW